MQRHFSASSHRDNNGLRYAALDQITPYSRGHPAGQLAASGRTILRIEVGGDFDLQRRLDIQLLTEQIQGIMRLRPQTIVPW